MIARGSIHGLRAARLPGRESADPLPATAAAGVAVRVVRVRARRRSLHRHECAEVIHVLEGAGGHWQRGERVDVAAGDVVLVPAGVPHATVAAPGDELTLLCYFPATDPDPEELPGEVAF
jgi:quercetin dioxygenase-like cupin family protein